MVTKYKIAADCANGAWVARGAFVFVKRNPTESDESDDDETTVLTLPLFVYVNSGDEGCD